MIKSKVIMEFKTNDLRDEVEDQLFFMYRSCGEIEMHINAVLGLNELVSNNQLIGDLTSDMIFYHNELALIRTAFILKSKPQKDEVNSLFSMEKFLAAKQLRLNDVIFEKITTFYNKYQKDIDKLIKRRDGDAHKFKVKKQIKLSRDNEISLDKHLMIIIEAKEIIEELYILLFKKKLSKDLTYPKDLYYKIYSQSIEIIKSEVHSMNS